MAKTLARLAPNRTYVKFPGTCPCCEGTTTFAAFGLWFRDELKCLRCASIPRERALMLAIESHFPGWKDLDIHESSPFDRGATWRLSRQAKGYVGSHFHPGRPLGTMVDGFRNIDLQRQDFQDNSFDLVITQDVLEHLPDPDAAIREIHRTLRPGGAHVFTVPLVNRHRPSETWAVIGKGGEVEFLHEPEYHGNPIDAKGAPVMMHWGFDLLARIADLTGMRCTVEDWDDPSHGIVGRFNEVIVAIKA